MDPATIVGITVAFLAVAVGLIMDGGDPASLFMPSAIVIVFGGALGATLATGLLSDAITSMKSVMPALTSKGVDSAGAIESIIRFAGMARKDGLLSLDQHLKTVDDEFLREGLQMAVDGTDPEELDDLLAAEISAKRKEDAVKVGFFNQLGTFGPTMGVIGTIMGLVGVLQNLSSPETLGPLIASAFLTTLYGVLMANLFAIPLAKRISRLSELEVRHMEMVVEGVLSIQAGANPRLISQKLSTYLPAADRPTELVKAA